MKVRLPTSLNVEIEYWQKYREKYLVPAIRERHSTEIPSIFTLALYGKTYDIPIEVTGYNFETFVPLPQPSVMKNWLIAKGQDPEKSNKELDAISNEYYETIESIHPTGLKLAKHVAIHSQEYKTNISGKIVGNLLSTPFPRKSIDDEIWILMLEKLFEMVKSRQIFEGMSGLRRKLAERTYRGKILDYADIFASVIYHEDTREYSAFTPDRQKLDIEFFDLKKQKELRDHKIIRLLKRIDEKIPSHKPFMKDEF